MAAISIVGGVSQSKQQFSISTLVGTETVSTVVGAGKVALILDSAVAKRSLSIDVITERLADALREAGYQ